MRLCITNEGLILASWSDDSIQAKIATVHTEV